MRYKGKHKFANYQIFFSKSRHVSQRDDLITIDKSTIYVRNVHNVYMCHNAFNCSSVYPYSNCKSSLE